MRKKIMITVSVVLMIAMIFSITTVAVIRRQITVEEVDVELRGIMYHITKVCDSRGVITVITEGGGESVKAIYDGNTLTIDTASEFSDGPNVVDLKAMRLDKASLESYSSHELQPMAANSCPVQLSALGYSGQFYYLTEKDDGFELRKQYVTVTAPWKTETVKNFERQLYAMNRCFLRLPESLQDYFVITSFIGLLPSDPTDISVGSVIWNLLVSIIGLDKLPLAIPSLKEWHDAEELAIKYFNQVQS